MIGLISFCKNTSDEIENVDNLCESDERAEINEVLFWGPQVKINTIPVFIKHKSIFQIRQQEHVSYFIVLNTKVNFNL